jgi:hypothetical protein
MGTPGEVILGREGFKADACYSSRDPLPLSWSRIRPAKTTSLTSPEWISLELLAGDTYFRVRYRELLIFMSSRFRKAVLDSWIPAMLLPVNLLSIRIWR